MESTFNEREIVNRLRNFSSARLSFIVKSGESFRVVVYIYLLVAEVGM